MARSVSSILETGIPVQAETTSAISSSVTSWRSRRRSEVTRGPSTALASAYAALNAGQVDGVVIDTPINLGQASQSNGELEVVGQFKTGEEYGAIFGLGNGKKAIFDPIIQSMIDDGTVNGLIAKYLGGDPSTVPFIDIPAA